MLLRFAIALTFVFSLTACSGTRPTDLGVGPNGLGGCPPTPNCVSSDATDEDHRIASFTIEGPPDAAWAALDATIGEMPRTVVVTSTPDYLHVEFTSAVMRYVDDVEFRLRADERLISVRSASRVGRSDLGVNRARIEAIRAAMQTRGVLD